MQGINTLLLHGLGMRLICFNSNRLNYNKIDFKSN